MIYDIPIVQLVNGCEEAVMNELKDMMREQSPVAKHDDSGYLMAELHRAPHGDHVVGQCPALMHACCAGRLA
eukprot:13025220-Alexandrium_andersonii.AAC.1